MAVYTHIDDQELRDFLSAYDVGALVSYQGIVSGVTNSNYLIITTTGRHILTLFEKRVATGDLPFFMELMLHLSTKNFPCPQPHKKRNGDVLSLLAGKMTCLVSFLDGVSITEATTTHCQQAGATLARLHVAGADFTIRRKNDLSLEGWHHLAAETASKADSVAPGLQRLIQEELDFLSASWPKALPQGVIHADFFKDNVFFQDGNLSGVIDFYFACDDLYAYDLAVTANPWCFSEDFVFDRDKMQNLISGYQSIRPLTIAEREALPILLRGATLRFLLTRLYDWLNQIPGALVKPHNPMEYVKKLTFHRQASPADYGL